MILPLESIISISIKHTRLIIWLGKSIKRWLVRFWCYLIRIIQIRITPWLKYWLWIIWLILLLRVQLRLLSIKWACKISEHGAKSQIIKYKNNQLNQSLISDIINKEQILSILIIDEYRCLCYKLVTIIKCMNLWY